jgi:Domain of unknown function (DUF4139)/N-terminal domain of unknown function (DUF4140)
MQQYSFIILAFCLGFSGTTTAAGAEKIVIPATLRSATVYRSGAELVHSASARLEQGSNEVVIGELSNSIDQTSIRIGCTASVTIMSVTFSTDYLKPETTSPFVRKLQDSLAAVRAALARVEILDRSDTELLDLLNANKSIGSSTTGVSVGDLQKMMDYYKQKTVELRTELGGYAEKAEKLKQESDRLQDQIAEEKKKNGRTGGCLVLQLLSPLAGPCDFTISYLTTAAHWDPFYDLKVNNITEPLHILYKAKVVQTSGIDWKHVKLSLSTSRPSQGGNAPVLKTWFLKYVDPIANQPGYINALEGRVAGLQIKNNAALNEVVVVGYSAAKVSGEAPVYTEPLYIVNGKEISAEEYNRIDRRAIKTIDELKGKDATTQYGARGGPGVYIVTLKDELSDYVDVSDRQMDVVFDLDIPYDLAGNGKEQGVVLKEYQMPCSYQYYSAPRVDKDAYLLGEMADWEKLNLLPGEANIIVEGTYVGKSYIDPNSTQDHLNLTLGRDKRIAIKKEKVADYSSVKFLGANKKEVFTYELTVRNNKKEKVSLLLKDQYPISSSKDIEEELLDSGGATVNKDTGILMWNVDLGAGESKKFRISYSIKYPKDKILNIN